MVEIFKPEDFEEQFGSVEQARANRELSAKIANAKLNKLIESWPVVYGFADKHGWFKPDTEANENATHKARLAFIEEIKKECVKHEPVFSKERVSAMMFNFDDKSEFYKQAHCKHCGVELQATWSEKK